MTRGKLRLAWLILAGISIGIGLGTVALTHWLQLEPCHLCIFQRLLMLIFGTLAIATAIASKRRWAMSILGALALCASTAGAASAAYQSWIQMQPPGAVTCVNSDPGIIERFVEWLGQHLPSLFLATGFCEDEGFSFAGLSLANWSFIAFFVLSAAVAVLLLRPSPPSEG